MLAPRWFVADLRTGRQILDLPIMTGKWERFLNAPERLDATLDMRDPHTIALRPRIAAAPGRSILACAFEDTILAAGPIWAHNYDRDRKTLKLTAAGIWSYFDHRYVLPIAAATTPVNEFTIPDPSAAGKTKPNPTVGTYLSALEYGTIAKRWVQQAQAWTGGSVPVVFEADRAGTRERNIEGADFRNVGTVLTQLSQIEGGPDIRFFPRLTGDRLGIEFLLQTGSDASPLLTGGPHLWDLTAPESAVSNFQVNVDATGMAGTAWATAGRSADKVLVARSIDPTLTAAGYPLLETLDSSHTTVSEQGTLDAYAAEATLRGRSPLETWDFDVEAAQQPHLGSFWEGDWCDVTVAGYDSGSYSDWVVQRRNDCPSPTPKTTSTVTNGWAVGGGTIALDLLGLKCTTNVVTTPYFFSARSDQSYAVGDTVTLAVKYRVDNLPAGSANTHVTVRPHKRTGNVYYTAAQVIRPVVEGQTETVIIQWTATEDIAANELDVAVVGCNAAGGFNNTPIGFVWAAGNVLIEDGHTDGGYYDGSTPDPNEWERYEWTGLADLSPSVYQTRETIPGGTGDPYLYEKQESHRRITYIAGDHDGLTVSIKTMERI